MIKKIIVGIGDMAVTDDQDSQIITYALGSCIGLTVYDSHAKVGGIIHIMLPKASTHSEASRNPFMFADTGLPLFFDELYKFGAKKGLMEIKMAGGANLFNDNKIFNIGEKNFIFIKEYLAERNLLVKRESIGGTCCRTMSLSIGTGKVCIKIPGLGKVEL